MQTGAAFCTTTSASVSWTAWAPQRHAQQLLQDLAGVSIWGTAWPGAQADPQVLEARPARHLEGVPPSRASAAALPRACDICKCLD